jgi:hypothetical protein
MLCWFVSIRSTLRRTRNFRVIRPFRAASFTSFMSSSPRVPPSPIFRTLFQVPYPASPLFATLTKTAGSASKIPILELIPLLEHSHPRSFFSCTYVEPILQVLYFHIHPWKGGVHPQPANLPLGSIAAKRLWCNNLQRRANSQRPWETFMLPLVSNYRSREGGSVRLG